MKKKIIIGALSSVLVLGGAFAVGAANNDGGNKTEVKVNNDGGNKAEVKGNGAKTLLSYDEVEKIALQEVDGVVEEVELERKGNTAVYEIEIEQEGFDYDLHIDAYSGEIYSVERDDDDDFLNYENIISQPEAIAIAEKAANGKMVAIELDEDDGLLKYDVELKTDRGEAEVEIDASTGKVLEVELDD